MSTSVRSLLAQNSGRIRLLEAHDRNSREIIRNVVNEDGQGFHGIWISGLTQTTYLGVPDTELISPLNRASLLAQFHDHPQQNKCRGLCAAYDADSGGNVTEIPALIESLASAGVSMIVVEDKSVSEPGKKVNSLEGTLCLQGQANMYEFAKVLCAFKSASAHREMMITARIESFTVRITKHDGAEEKESVRMALHDALKRAHIYRSAGADAIMIHSKSTLPVEVTSFLTGYRSRDPVTPLVVVPTTYSKTTEKVLYEAGANVIIYANHLMRAKISAVGEFSDAWLVSKPGVFSQDAELRTCLRARNFGCLLRKLFAKDLGDQARQYRVVAEERAKENMNTVVKCLLEGKMSGAADKHIISIKELLRINAHQICMVESLTE
jgi:2-methylisocitrate lyase-like PEP mutase family enzyme